VINDYYTFDDVLILPNFSTIKSRKDVDLSTQLSSTVNLRLPIISANMDTITDSTMAIKIAQLGGMGILHRFSSIETNVNSLKTVLNASISPFQVGVSIGLGDLEKERLAALYAAGARVICIDVAHGAQETVIDQAKYAKTTYPDITLIVGNFATKDTIQCFQHLVGEGVVDVYKTGIGGGSVCSTRLKTGVGVPQLSAIVDTATYRKGEPYKIIADGGIRNSGDAAKALAAGADCLMLGGLLAGTDETPGQIINGNQKVYRGSASKESYDDQGKTSDWRTAEGVSITVPYKGPVELVIKDLEGGVRSSMTYTGSSNLTEFRNNARFIRVSNSTQLENKPHKGSI